MTLRDVVNYLLMSLGTGQVNDQDELVLHVFYESADKIPFSNQLVFRTLERSVRWLKKYEHFSFKQPLTEDNIQLIYDTFRAQVQRASLPEIQDDASQAEIRQAALALLEEVITQHKYLCFLIHQREFQTHR